MSKHFCDNKQCPNHKLPLPDEKHYHSFDRNFVGGQCGILKSHRIIEEIPNKNWKWYHWFYKSYKSYIKPTIIKEYWLCDICISVYKKRFKEQ